MEGCLALVLAQVEVRPGYQQQSHDIQMPVRRGRVKRSQAVRQPQFAKLRLRLQGVSLHVRGSNSLNK